MRKPARAALVTLAAVCLPLPVSAHVGPSYLKVAGAAGDARVAPYKTWIRAEANYWKSQEGGLFGGNGLAKGGRNSFRRSRQVFSGPPGPTHGPDQLMLAIDRHSGGLPALMAACRDKTVLPEVDYAESSVLARGLREMGSKPAGIPDFFEYRLSGVKVSQCPVVANAPEQAIVLSFADIGWTNFHGTELGVEDPLQPAVLTPASSSGSTKTFVVSWYGVANDVSDDQCPVLNEKPPESAFYTYMSPKEAAREKVVHAGKGGVHYEDGEIELRGPGRLNATLLPGILPDPGLAVPKTKFARGLDLDGDDGSGKPPAGVRRHVNYLSTDGRRGIDNQLFTVEGCMPGQQGHKGFLMQYSNEQRRNGLISMLVQISGIDDARNDDHVDVTILYSRDPMAKSASGKAILADYTFGLSDNVEFSHFATRLHGRIVNGVIETERVPVLQIHAGLEGEQILYRAGMRLQIQPDGTLKGVVGGYQDWRKIMMINGNSNAEFHYGFQSAGMYYAFKRFADGLRDPVTGDYNGISSAYDIEGVPAFLPPRQQMALTAARPLASRER